MMEKPIFPSKNMRITQGYGEGSHIDSFAIDNGGLDSNIEDIYAPFTGTIKKIYPNDANEVWLESLDKVEYPDGTIDYLTVMFAHNNDVSNLFVGKQINQGEAFYKEGTKGNATGNHCHIECGLGKFSGNGWHQNSNGYWSIDNGKKPEECLWIDDSINVIDNYGYNFKKVTETVEKENGEKKESTDSVDKKDTTETIPKEDTSKDKIFTAPKTDLYGVYLKENQQVIIKSLTK